MHRIHDSCVVVFCCSLFIHHHLLISFKVTSLALWIRTVIRWQNFPSETPENVNSYLFKVWYAMYWAALSPSSITNPMLLTYWEKYVFITRIHYKLWQKQNKPCVCLMGYTLAFQQGGLAHKHNVCQGQKGINVVSSVHEALLHSVVFTGLRI